MAYTIFYSWQSDLPNNINRNFIEAALQGAIKKVAKDFEIQEALRDETMRLDKDTKDVPGFPPIADVIFDKISKCSIFVPDLTFVGKSIEGRSIPNANVLIEYGWALRELTHSRIIPIMNAAFGEPTVETLPFDMRHLRFPITYNLKGDEDREKRLAIKAELSDKLVYAISLIVKSTLLEETSTDIKSFTETPHTVNPSTFLEEGKPLARRPSNGGEQVFYLPNEENLFLRLIPIASVEPIETSKKALEMAKAGKLIPMSAKYPGTYGRNRYGAFVCYDNEGKIKSLTQLFLNRELWGINADIINKEQLMSRAEVKFGYFPCVDFEDCFIATLDNYLKFAKEILNLQLPLRFRVGATDVEGYRMPPPPGMHYASYESFAGNVVNKNIIHEGIIEDYTTKVTDILRPFFNYVWEECGLERPDKEIL